jgi:hypothetical protein
MPASKIVDETEVLRWFAEGQTYEWMINEYLTKYNIETTVSLWANFRRRRNLEPRTNHDAELIPWTVQERHRWAYPLQMLRIEGRVRAGGARPTGSDAARHHNFILRLRDRGEVITYLPDTPEGFHYIARDPSQDAPDALVRKPRQARHAARDVRV